MVNNNMLNISKLLRINFKYFTTQKAKYLTFKMKNIHWCITKSSMGQSQCVYYIQETELGLGTGHIVSKEPTYA